MMCIKPQYLILLGLYGVPVSSVFAFSGSLEIVGKGAGLSLAQAMNQAERVSSALKAQEAAVTAAEARRSQALGAMGPRLSLEAQRAWIDPNSNKLAGETLPNGVRYPDEVSNAGVQITQPITAWFSLDNKADAEQHLSLAAKAEREAGGQDLRAKTAENFLKGLKSIRLREVARQSLTVIQRQKKDAQLLQNQGKLAPLDFSRFAFAESEAVTQLAEAEAQLAIAEQTLREQLDTPAGQALQLEDVDPKISEANRNPALARPELKGAEQKVQAYRSYQSAANIDFYPNINAFARFDRDFAAKDIIIPLPGAPTYPKEDYRDRFSYGLTLQWVLWDGMSRSARDRELAAESERASRQSLALASQLRVETAQALADWERTQQTLRNAELSAKLSEEIFHAFTTKFKSGLATTTDVLSAERDLTRARAQLISSGYDLRLAAIRLNRAQGQTIL